MRQRHSRKAPTLRPRGRKSHPTWVAPWPSCSAPDPRPQGGPHMPSLILTLIAPIGAWVHLRRHPEPASRRRTIEVYLRWWLALAIGATGVIGALFHIFDGPQIAREIGFTRGDGGFQ